MSQEMDWYESRDELVWVERWVSMSQWLCMNIGMRSEYMQKCMKLWRCQSTWKRRAHVQGHMIVKVMYQIGMWEHGRLVCASMSYNVKRKSCNNMAQLIHEWCINPSSSISEWGKMTNIQVPLLPRRGRRAHQCSPFCRWGSLVMSSGVECIISGWAWWGCLVVDHCSLWLVGEGELWVCHIVG